MDKKTQTTSLYDALYVGTQAYISKFRRNIDIYTEYEGNNLLRNSSNDNAYNARRHTVDGFSVNSDIY